VPVAFIIPLLLLLLLLLRRNALTVDASHQSSLYVSVAA